MTLYYRLNEFCDPVACDQDQMVLAFRARRHVAETYVLGCRVSTVFLVIDHSFMGTVPVLFETMIFDSNGDGLGFGRYSYWDAAWIGHQYAVGFVLSKRLLGFLDR